MTAQEALDLETRQARRFTRRVLAIVLLGMIFTTLMALLVDPLRVFGTGRIPSALTGERDEKPDAFLAQTPPAQAVVLGSSRVMKLRPSCVAELTGYPTYNFGLSNGLIEDMYAVVGFIHAHERTPLRMLVIGLDIEEFDDRTEVDPRLLSAHALHPYVPGSATQTWSTITQALFGWQGLRYGLISLRNHLHPSSQFKLLSRNEADGLVRYDEWEGDIAKGTFSSAPLIAKNAERFKTTMMYRGFTEISAHRLAMFRELVTRERARGVEIHVFIPPIHRTLAAARSEGPIDARTRDLDRALRAMAAQGLFHYLPLTSAADFGGDVDGYYDGMHLTEINATRLLLAAFGQRHGCGI